MFNGNLTIGLGVTGSCTEPAQINLTSSDTVGALQTVKKRTQVVDCFRLRWSTKSSFGSWSKSNVDFISISVPLLTSIPMPVLAMLYILSIDLLDLMGLILNQCLVKSMIDFSQTNSVAIQVGILHFLTNLVIESSV